MPPQSDVSRKRSVRFPGSKSPFLVDEACFFKFIVLDKPPGLLKIALKVGRMCCDKRIVECEDFFVSPDLF